MSQGYVRSHDFKMLDAKRRNNATISSLLILIVKKKNSNFRWTMSDFIMFDKNSFNFLKSSCMHASCFQGKGGKMGSRLWNKPWSLHGSFGPTYRIYLQRKEMDIFIRVLTKHINKTFFSGLFFKLPFSQGNRAKFGGRKRRKFVAF